jgi:hypothetical protein
MPTPTYDLIASTTLAASTSEIVFGSLPQTYRDLIIVFAGTVSGSGSGGMEIQFNGVPGSVSAVFMGGTAGGTPSGTSDDFFGVLDSAGQSNMIAQIMDYSATDKHKTYLSRSAAPVTSDTWAIAGRWASTAAITSIKVLDTGGRTFQSGLTASVYGIAS